jgi:hypothetical protein
MKQLALITPGKSDLDPRLEKVLEESGMEKDDFEDLDWFSLIPFFVLAGASVETESHAHGDHAHFIGAKVVLPEDMTPHFFVALPQMLAQLQQD